MHAAINAAAGVAVFQFEGDDRVQMYWSITGVTALVAVIVVGSKARWWMKRQAFASPVEIRAVQIDGPPA
jgi:signal recognition particle receptor subunit beta